MRKIGSLLALALCLAGTAAAQEPPAEAPVTADAVDPDAVAPDTVEPIPAWLPAGDGFEARIKALAEHVKKHNPTNDHRVFNRIVFVTARAGSRVWIGRDVWNDGKVRFAVGRENEITDPLTAIKAAEAKANAVLDGTDTSGSRRLLDWTIDDEGVTYALVGRWLTLAEQGLAPSP